ncbi:MAG TPA: O-antigen ligase family protein [Stellaceae bacterium]|jgi:O-antigen ligase
MPTLLGRERTIVGAPAKSTNRQDGWPAAWCEGGLGAALFVLPPLLALVSRGAAALEGMAGLCAFGLVLTRPAVYPTRLRHPAMLLALLVVWGALSAAWSIVPDRSLLLAVRLLGLFAAGLALAAAAARIEQPRRLLGLLVAGSALGIAVAAGDRITGGRVNALLHDRIYLPAETNQVMIALAILVLPAVAAMWPRHRALAVVATIIAVVAIALSVDESAKLGLALAVLIGALAYWRRRITARLLVFASVLFVILAPLTLPRLAHMPRLFDTVDNFKESAGHRLLIWSFVGDHIAEYPFLGWGLDSSRAIPGGGIVIRPPGETWLPLHPHNAALQVWLELGAVGVLPCVALLALLWYRVAGAAWPRLYGAAAAGSLAAALTVGFLSYGVWQEWWLGTLALALFAVLVLGRVATPPPPATPASGRSGPTGAS